MILEYIASDGEVMNALKKVNDIRIQIPLIRSLWLCIAWTLNFSLLNQWYSGSQNY